MIGMGFGAFLTLFVIGFIAAAVMHSVVRYRFLNGVDGFFAKWIVGWLGGQPDRSVLVVTGSPGAGKSAVLGRIVTTADAGIRGSLPAGDTAVCADVGSVSCAVHAKGKTVLEVAEEIARAASAALPEQPTDLAPAIQAALSGGGRGPLNVIMDALDEAADPGHARAIIGQVVLPLAETCAAAGARMVVGTRRRDDAGDLLGRFGAALTVVDMVKAVDKRTVITDIRVESKTGESRRVQ